MASEDDQIELMAQAVHERYLRDHAPRKGVDDPSLKPWVELEDGLRESNLAFARHVPEKLDKVNLVYARARGVAPAPFTLTEEQIEDMAELEHERWVLEREEAGWKMGPRDPSKKTTPYLLPWDELSEEIKEYDRETVRAIPEILALAGFEIRQK